MIRFPGFLVLAIVLATLSACGRSDNTLNFPSPKIPVPEALLEIYNPVNGSVLPANSPFILEYEVVRGEKGHHVKIQIDDQKPDIINEIRGRHFIEGLEPGPHTIILKEYTRQGAETGGIAIIHISME